MTEINQGNIIDNSVETLKRKREEDQKQNGDTMKMVHIIHNL
jgi:hypothetical protein